MAHNFKSSILNSLQSLFIACMLIIFTGSLVICNATEQDTLLFPQIKSWDLQRIKITDKNNRVLDFKRKMCVWTLSEEGLATNEARVTDLADQIINLSYQKAIAGQERTFEKYMVSPNSYSYRIDLGLPDEKITTVYLGSEGEGHISHARPTEATDIFVLNSPFIKTITMEQDFWLSSSDVK